MSLLTVILALLSLLGFLKQATAASSDQDAMILDPPCDPKPGYFVTNSHHDNVDGFYKQTNVTKLRAIYAKKIHRDYDTLPWKLVYHHIKTSTTFLVILPNQNGDGKYKWSILNVKHHHSTNKNKPKTKISWSRLSGSTSSLDIAFKAGAIIISSDLFENALKYYPFHQELLLQLSSARDYINQLQQEMHHKQIQTERVQNQVTLSRNLSFKLQEIAVPQRNVHRSETQSNVDDVQVTQLQQKLMRERIMHLTINLVLCIILCFVCVYQRRKHRKYQLTQMNTMLQNERIYERRITELEQQHHNNITELQPHQDQCKEQEKEDKLSSPAPDGTETIVSASSSDHEDFGAKVLNARVVNDIAMNDIVNEICYDMDI